MVPVKEPEVDNTQYEWAIVAKARRRGYSYTTGSGLAVQLQNGNIYNYQELTADRITDLMQEMFAQCQETNNQSMVMYTSSLGERMIRNAIQEETRTYV